MEKTIKSLLLLMIITGTIFTACGPETTPPIEAESAAEEGILKEEEKVDEGGGVVKVEEVVGSGKEVANPTKEVVAPGVVENPTVTVTPSINVAPKPVPAVAPAQPVAPVENNPPVQTEPVSIEPAVIVVASKYIDGSYTRSGSYQSPAGAEAISVTVTIKNDEVQSMSVFPSAINDTSKGFQGLFISGINQLVVGKKLSDVGAVGQVNGSSLTGDGFNSAIGSIKTAALR